MNGDPLQIIMNFSGSDTATVEHYISFGMSKGRKTNIHTLRIIK